MMENRKERKNKFTYLSNITNGSQDRYAQSTVIILKITE
jgi:hypothetical protein